jgi:hypothetical protein
VKEEQEGDADETVDTTKDSKMTTAPKPAKKEEEVEVEKDVLDDWDAEDVDNIV